MINAHVFSEAGSVREFYLHCLLAVCDTLLVTGEKNIQMTFFVVPDKTNKLGE